MTQRDLVFDAVKSIGKLFTRPDDDWSPIMLLETKTGPVITALSFDSADSKEAFAIALPSLLRKLGATLMALVVSAWTLYTTPIKYELQMAMGDGSIRDHPDRQEKVMVTFADHTGAESWGALITRSEHAPPELCEFTKMDMDDAKSTGRFSHQALIAAMRYATKEIT